MFMYICVFFNWRHLPPYTLHNSMPGCCFSNICPRNICMFSMTALVRASLFLMCTTMTTCLP